MIRSVFFCCLIFASSIIFAQNQAPVLSNVIVTPDSVLHTIDITYDLFDNESDDVEIIVKLSDDNGETFFTNYLTATGDIGFPVPSGTGKSISLTYNPGITYIKDYVIKIIADDHAHIDIQDLVDQVDSLNLINDLQWVQGIRHYITNPIHLEEVKEFIENRFRSKGLQTYRQPFVHQGYDAHNIIGRLPGLGDEGKTYIIDGHFDTVSDSPGADDNGSAVVGMLEAMRILSQYSFEHSIKFIGFDFEETANNLGREGSLRYVNDGIKDYEEIDGVINFEMIGYFSNQPNTQDAPVGFNLIFPTAYNQLEADSFRGNFLTNVSNDPSSNLGAVLDSLAAVYVPDLKVISVVSPGTGLAVPDLLRSDHSRFWTDGIRALMLTDGADFRNFNYHSPNDTLENLNFTFMANIVKATVATIAHLAKIQHSAYAVKALYPNPLAVSNISTDCDIHIFSGHNEYLIELSLENCSREDFKLEILDIDGKVIKQAYLGQNKLYRFNAEDLATGAYFAVLRNADQIISKHFVIY